MFLEFFYKEGREFLMTTQFTIPEIKLLIQELQRIFDIVRLVDPLRSAIIEFNDKDEFITQPEKCFAVWNKDARCENCISYRAYTTQCRTTKCESIGNDTFFVISKPFICLDALSLRHLLNIEIVSLLADDIMLKAIGKDQFANRIKRLNTKIYEDPLTNTFNRRYYDEKIFCHNTFGDIASPVAFIALKLENLKEINERCGYAVGDMLLQQVGRFLVNHMRRQDAVIRYNGFEFLIVLNESDQAAAEKKAAAIREEIQKLTVDPARLYSLVARTGCAATDAFTEDTECIEALREATVQKLS